MRMVFILELLKPTSHVDDENLFVEKAINRMQTNVSKYSQYASVSSSTFLSFFSHQTLSASRLLLHLQGDDFVTSATSLHFNSKKNQHLFSRNILFSATKV